MTKFSWSIRACGISLLWVTIAIALPAQTLTTLHNFDNTDGANPTAGLVQGTDGNFYGTTEDGGAHNAGTVFKITPNGTLTTLYSFAFQPDGATPNAGLVQASDGNFYGTTNDGGTHNAGTVFKITLNGTLTILHSFAFEPDGANPLAGLIQASNGKLYGTTNGGGTNNTGTVFEITLSGTLTILHSFGFEPEGANPYGGLVQGTDGNFYGTTGYGGDNNFGTVFDITPSGTLTILYSFDNIADGANPEAGLVLATNGNFYGTTAYGGTSTDCAFGSPCGTVFEITPSGTLTTIHSFNNTGGANPNAGLVQGTDGNFYGTAEYGGTSTNCIFGSACGTVFEITPSGTLTTLDSFDFMDGANPEAALVQGTDGSFYGTAMGGGASNFGTVFSLSVGLGPFVETEPASGKVGAHVKILGINLTGTTNVRFNGTTATFTVVSSSEITATVPSGATTGRVEVKAPGGTLKSNVPFRVRQ